MYKLKIIILIILLLLVVNFSGCVSEDKKGQQDYQKCVEVCSSVLTEDYVTMHLCNEECKQRFLNSS